VVGMAYLTMRFLGVKRTFPRRLAVSSYEPEEVMLLPKMRPNTSSIAGSSLHACCNSRRSVNMTMEFAICNNEFTPPGIAPV